MTVYAVVQYTDNATDVDSVWISRELAQKRVDILGGGVWLIDEIEVLTEADA